jgi:ammonia channel protein AmtB
MASAVFLNTLVAGCLGMLGWIAVERLRDGRPTTFGAASGVIAGLVAITPSCGTANTLGAAPTYVVRPSRLRRRAGSAAREGRRRLNLSPT